MEVKEQPMTQQERDRRKANILKRRKREVRRKILSFVILIASICLGVFCVKKFGASKERANLDKYYGIKSENQLAVIIDNQVIGAKGMIENQTLYVEYGVVRDYLNARFYVDMTENLLLYTLPQGTIEAEVGSNQYTLQKDVKTKEYPILKMEGDTAYVALRFVQEYTNLDFTYYKNPNRVMIVSEWGDTVVAEVRKGAKVREKDSIKSPILTEVAKKESVTVIESKGKWKQIRTEDGIIGYIKSGSLKKESTKKLSREFEKQVYPNISKDYTINVAWHMVTERDANNEVLEKIADAKGLTTIAPTWFSVKNTKGALSSLASAKYVEYAQRYGVEVWAMIQDNDEAETYELLSRTSYRENLINQLVAEALKNKIDGINVNFENVSEECAEHYLQFLRELSLKCRQMEIVLSVNRPVTANYDMKEQGEVVDYVILMSYDEHGLDSEKSGPGASLPFVEKELAQALKQVPKEKLIQAIPFFTRLWKEEEESEKVSSFAYGMSRIQNIIKDAGAKIAEDKETGLHYAEWQNSDGVYKVWIEDKDSIEKKLVLMKEAELAGVAAWRMGFETEDVWELILKYVN